MPKEIYIDGNGNERILSSSPSALSGLLDTDITTPTQPNQVLAYDSNGKVVNTKFAIVSDTVSGTTNADGLISTGKLCSEYIYLGTITNNSQFIIPLNALSDGIIRLQIRNSSFAIQSNTNVSIVCYFLKIA